MVTQITLFSSSPSLFSLSYLHDEHLLLLTITKQKQRKGGKNRVERKSQLPCPKSPSDLIVEKKLRELKSV